MKVPVACPLVITVKPNRKINMQSAILTKGILISPCSLIIVETCPSIFALIFQSYFYSSVFPHSKLRNLYINSTPLTTHTIARNRLNILLDELLATVLARTLSSSITFLTLGSFPRTMYKNLMKNNTPSRMNPIELITKKLVRMHFKRVLLSIRNFVQQLRITAKTVNPRIYHAASLMLLNIYQITLICMA